MQHNKGEFFKNDNKGQQRQDQNKANDKDDNFEQSEARAYSG